jgi:hypothetical protein
MKSLLVGLALSLLAALSPAQTTPPNYSGTYSFLKEGEFVQITVEDAGKVTGFVSRYGEEDNEKTAFLDHFFKEGKLDGTNLTFTTQTVHGVWFDFKGAFERGQAKTSSEEGFYVLKGVVTRNYTDANKKVTTTPVEVSLKSFPDTMEATPPPKD